MRNNKIGTREHFEEFMANQAKLYGWMMRDHFGLPDPAMYKGYYYRLVEPVYAHESILNPNPSPIVQKRETEFVKEVFAVGGNKIDLWIQRKPV